MSSFATLGTTQIAIRDLVKSDEERRNQILGTCFVLMLIAGVLFTIGITYVGYLLNDEKVVHILIAIASIQLTLNSFNVFDYYFQSKLLSKYSVYSRLSSNVVKACLQVIFIILAFSVIYLALAIIVGLVVQNVIWYINYRNKVGRVSEWSFDKEYAKNLLGNSWPLIFQNMLSNV